MGQNSVYDENSVNEEQVGINLSADINPVFHYALQQNHVALVRSVSLKNIGPFDMENIEIRIFSNVELIEPFVETIDMLPTGEEYILRNPKLKVHGEFLASLTERSNCLIFVSASQNNSELEKVSEEITVLAYDEWPGLRYSADLLAAFVTPNHPVINSLLLSASKWLEKWTGNPSLEGYQSNNPNRVVSMSAAAYAAIQEKNITYANPPASFEDIGQRVRLADAVIEMHMGTCLDMTLLYAAVLEAMGLNALLIMTNGHIFAGVWLIDDSFSEPCMDDPSVIEKRIAEGVNEIIVVECTAMNAGKDRDFDEARKIGNSNLADYSSFEFVIDLTRARKSGIRPLPIRVSGSDGYHIEYQERTKDRITAAPQMEAQVIDVTDEADTKTTKQIQWERKLLDLSMRNMLINMRINNSVVPILIHQIAKLEDNLSDGAEYELLPRPAEWDIHEINSADAETVNDLGPYSELIDIEMKHHRLHSWMGESSLNKLLTKMYRSVKTSMEENGASTLYLSLGLLRWYDGVKTSRVHYAPIILIPIDIIRKPAAKGYVIRKRDDDAQVNITLLEFLKQNFNMEIMGVNPPPVDEHGIDIEKIFAIFRHAIMNKKMWNIIESAYIGNFSFSQFVMWNDIHSHSNLLEGNKIVKALMNGVIDWDTTIPENVDTDDAYLPVSVDASQLRAINMAANDVSFVLHGPPGTGKSQTITAMIANALAKGKTVLFVAEKMAALEVVQKRLSTLGIADFCLELHSNKAVKRNVLDQLKRGLDIRVWGLQTDYEQKFQQIHAMRMELDEYYKKLHEQRNFGMSVRDLMDLYESVPDHGKKVRIDKNCAITITQQRLEKYHYLLQRLVSAGRIVRHPKNHPLNEVMQTEYSQVLRIRLEELLAEYEQTLLAIKNIEEIPNFLIKGTIEIQQLERLTEYQEKKLCFINRKAEIEKRWKDNFLKLDVTQLLVEFSDAKKKIFGKKKAIDAVVHEVQEFANFSVDSLNLVDSINEISVYKEKLQEYQMFESSIPEMERSYIDGGGDVSHLRQIKELFERLRDCEKELTELLKMPMNDEEGEEWLNKRIAICRNLQDHFSELKDWINFREAEKECEDAGLDEICTLYRNGLEHDEVEDVYFKSMYRTIIMSVVESEPVLNRFSGNRFNEQIKQYKQLEEEFLTLTKEEMFYKLSHNLPTGYEDSEMSRELAILRKAIRSGGRGISIRTLFEQIPHVLTKLCPCLLMSPISVAQYLAINEELFDIVIFDEASQLPTCKAVGVLARGKNAVIVGDPNQMPPTSFFAGNIIDEDNLDIEDLDSILDDCLALGMPESHLQWHYRSRHESLIAFSNQEYYENSMLTFPSVNDREKRVKLCTLNGIFNRKKGRINEREGAAVVKEIIRRYQTEELRGQTVGVVTFNIAQQGLIEDLLNEEYRKDPEFDKWANDREEALFVKNLENVQGDERDVILFSVTFGPDENGKFSLNFGPLNKEGGWKRLNVAISRARMEMIVFSSMTPEMIDLNRTKSKGVSDFRAFLEFAEKGRLTYNQVGLTGKRVKGIQQQILGEIEKLGLKCQQNVGHSNFKIDIAVINPFDEDEYLLGILLDGDSYKQSSNTKDREISQISVLEGLGWHLHRIWSMDWWDNRDKEISALKSLIEERKERARLEAENASFKDSGPESEEIISMSDHTERTVTARKKKDTTETKGFDQVERFRPSIPHQQSKEQLDEYLEKKKQDARENETAGISDYLLKDYVSENVIADKRITSAEYTSMESREMVLKVIEKIVFAEAPVSVERVVKKAMRAFGIGRSSAAVTETTEKLIRKLGVAVNRQNGMKFCWLREQIPESYPYFRVETNMEDRRTVEEICQQEIKNAICVTLQKNGVIDKDTLIRETARTMGYARAGATIVGAVERGLKYGRKTQEIKVTSDKLYTLGRKL